MTKFTQLNRTWNKKLSQQFCLDWTQSIFHRSKETSSKLSTVQIADDNHRHFFIFPRTIFPRKNYFFWSFGEPRHLLNLLRLGTRKKAVLPYGEICIFRHNESVKAWTRTILIIFSSASRTIYSCAERKWRGSKTEFWLFFFQIEKEKQRIFENVGHMIKIAKHWRQKWKVYSSGKYAKLCIIIEWIDFRKAQKCCGKKPFSVIEKRFCRT